MTKAGDTVDELNDSYGDGNFVYNMTLDSEFAPDKKFTGCEDYAPAYDFYLVVRENYCIGAVENRKSRKDKEGFK